MTETTMEIALDWRQEEENAWEEAAAAADNGRGIELRGVNVNSETDMEEVYEALNITKIGPKSRLRIYIQRLQTQQMRPVYDAAALSPVIEFAKQQKDAHTEGKQMSKAGYSFARLLLNDQGIQVRVDGMNFEESSSSSPLVGFDWSVTAKDEKKLRPGEHHGTHHGTPVAKDWFVRNFLARDEVLGLKTVTGCPLVFRVIDGLAEKDRTWFPLTHHTH